jgi:hypothetical protein
MFAPAYVGQGRRGRSPIKGLSLPLSRNRLCLTTGLVIRSLPLERSRAASIMEGAIERCALDHTLNSGSLDSASKGQHVSGLGSDYEVLICDRTLHTAGLIGPFEVTFNG